MRWKGLIVFFILFLMGVLISSLSVDRWIESGLEKAGQAVVGAKVDVDGLDFRLLDLAIEWDRLQVTDPNSTMQNVIETGRTAFRMRPEALLRKRVIIEEITLADVRSGTPRATDGALPKKHVSAARRRKPGVFDKVKAHLTQEIKQLPVFRFDPEALKQKIHVDSLMTMVDLKIVHRLDSVKKDITSTADKWQVFYRGFHPDEDLERIRDDFTGIDVQNIKTVPEAIAALEKVKSAQQTLSSLSETVDRKHQEIHQDIDRLASYQDKIDRWVDEDYHKILQKAQLPDLSAQNIGKVLFGTTVIARVEEVLNVIEAIQRLIPRKEEKPEKQKRPRMAGQTVHFHDRHRWPAFLVENVHLSGRTGKTEEHPGLTVQGEAAGITSQPWVYGKPTTIDLKGVRQDKRSLLFHADLDHTTEAPQDSFRLTIANVPLSDVSISPVSYQPFTLQKGNAEMAATVWMGKDRLGIRWDVTVRDILFHFSEDSSHDALLDIIRDVISTMDVLTLRADILSLGDDLDFRLNSNVDNRVSEGLKRITSRTLTETQNRIRTSLNRVRDRHLTDLEALFQEKKGMIQGPIDTYKNEAGNVQALIDEKIEALTGDIDRRTKGEEGKLKDLLQEILKKKKS